MSPALMMAHTIRQGLEEEDTEGGSWRQWLGAYIGLGNRQ
jgi:hypothetical protein